MGKFSKLLLTLLLVFSFAPAGHTQTIYEFQYKFDPPMDATVYHVFFVTYDDGSGFVRVRYDDPVSMDPVVIEIGIREHYIETSPGVTDSTKLYYDAGNQVIIAGGTQVHYKTPVFRSQQNPLTKTFDPNQVVYDEGHGKWVNGTMQNMHVLSTNDLTREFILQYYTEGEDFYTNLFGDHGRGLTKEEKDTKLILLVVANINDPVIGASCMLDRDTMVQTFKDLTDFMGIKLVTKTIFGKDYNKENVVSAIRDFIQPSSKDIVVFYYSGHGFRTSDDKSVYPRIDLRPKNDNTYVVNSLGIEDVFKQIDAKGARLNLVISDCCNTIPGANLCTGRAIIRSRSIEPSWTLNNCRALFLDPQRKSILITAADQNQRACSDNRYGGFFSIFFRKAMINYVTNLKANVNWFKIIQDAKEATKYQAEHVYCDAVSRTLAAQVPNSMVIIKAK